MKDSTKTQPKFSPSEIIINLFTEINKLLSEYIESNEPGLSLRHFIHGASPHSMSYNIIDFKIQSIYQKIKILNFQEKFKIQNNNIYLIFCDLLKHKKFQDLEKSLKSKNFDFSMVFLPETEYQKPESKNTNGFESVPKNQVKKSKRRVKTKISKNENDRSWIIDYQENIEVIGRDFKVYIEERRFSRDQLIIKIGEYESKISQDSGLDNSKISILELKIKILKDIISPYNTKTRELWGTPLRDPKSQKIQN